MKALSFHLSIETHWNRVLPRGGHPSPEDILAMEEADAVILPQGCREELYTAASRACDHVFPDYSARFNYPGKSGQAALFDRHNVRQPRYITVSGADKLGECDIPFPYPFVVKSSWGGEGKNVIPIYSADDMETCLVRAHEWEKKGYQGILVQEFIPTQGRSLRVVVIGTNYYSYWRMAGGDPFYTNLALGATIDHESFPHLQEKAVEEVKTFCKKSSINLAGFDFLFSTEEESPSPLFLEINYCFRTKGLGGPDRYLVLLTEGIRNWLAERVGTTA